MTDQDHSSLAEVLHGLQGMVVLSAYEHPVYAQLYRGWPQIRCRAFADGGRPREEVLWFSPNCSSAGLFEAV